MADQHITAFPITDLLSALGARPGTRKYTYHSPFREDKNASLHIDPNRNIWYDHGAGIGGGNIDLVMQCKRCTAKEAADFILSLPHPPSPEREKISFSGTPKISHSAPNRIVRVRYVNSPYLLDYCSSRGIPAALVVHYCREVTLRGKTAGRTYDHIGFLNNSGGYALKSPSGFKSTTKSGVTTIDMHGDFTDRPSSDTVIVFEGAFDFLSWLASMNAECPSADVAVLNSVANLSRAIPYLRLHKSIQCCLDNDDAGWAALKKLEELFKNSSDPAVIDCSHFYKEYNDVNDWWMAMKDLHNI